MTRLYRGKSARVATGALCAAVASSCLTVPAIAAPTTAATQARATAQTATSASRQYVAVSKSGTTQRLQLVDRASGKVVRTLASGRSADIEIFADADLAADGSVYAVVRNPRAGVYGTRLVRYAKGRATNLLSYVTSVEASPNGRQLAVTVVSPDGNGDRKGLEALRIVTTSGKLVRTLNSTAFPVTADGSPAYETGGLNVTGWLNAGTLVVRTGCCAASNVHIVRTDRPTGVRSWPSVHSSDDAMAIGTKGASVLLVRPYGGQPRSGIEAMWLSAKAPKGVVLTRLKGSNRLVSTSADALVKKYGATPLYVSPKRFPFKGTGSVLAAHV